jgi:hypothetical protein
MFTLIRRLETSFLLSLNELKYRALLGIQDKVKEFERLIMFIYHRNVFQLLR